MLLLFTPRLSEKNTSITGTYSNSIDEYFKNLVALSNAKANPWMAEKVTDGRIDYTQGDVSNIDPELLRATDYSKGDEKLPVFVPEFNSTKETMEDNDSLMVSSFELKPNGADRYGKTTITITIFFNLSSHIIRKMALI